MLPRNLTLPTAAVRGGVATFTPGALPNLSAAWEFVSGKLFQERTGASATTPAAVATDPIGTVAPSYGTSRYLTAGADANRPLLDTTGGDWSGVFDGVDDYLTAVGFAWSHAPHTIYAVASADAGVSSAVIAEAGTSMLGYGWRDTSNMRIVRTNTAADVAAGTPADGTRRRWAWRSPGVAVDGAFSSWTARRDGADVAGTVGAGTSSGFGTGTDSDVGRSTSEYYAGGLYVLLAYSRMLTVEELELLDSYYA